MAGFFEFSMMRIGDHYDQKILAHLFYQYLNVEEDFVKALFATGETQIGRAFVNESALTAETLYTCSITNGLPKSSRRPRTSASAPAIVATRHRI